MSSQAGISAWRGVSTASAGMTPSSFWRSNVISRCLSQPWANLPLYLSIHSLGTWCGACVAPGAKYMKNGLSPHQRLLLAHPVDRLVGQILGQVIALRRRLRRLDRRRALVQRRVPLVVLAADEAVEVLEPAATGRPGGERARRAGLPDRDLVALAELRRRVAVELERLRQRRLGVRQHRAVTGCRGGDLGDAAHAHRVVVAAGQQRLARRRAQRRGVEPRVLQPAGGELLEVGGVARPAEGAAGAVTDVVDEDDQHVGRALGWPQLVDRWIAGVRILRVIRRQPDVLWTSGMGRMSRRTRAPSDVTVRRLLTRWAWLSSRRISDHIGLGPRPPPTMRPPPDTAEF